jgi:hypothetical protein
LLLEAHLIVQLLVDLVSIQTMLHALTNLFMDFLLDVCTVLLIPVELVRDGQFAVSACQDFGTWLYHFGGKCELLAVQGEGLFVKIEIYLCRVCSFLDA